MSSNWTGWSIGEIRLIGEISGHYLRSTGEKKFGHRKGIPQKGKSANRRFGVRKYMSSNWPGWSIGEIRLIGEISGPQGLGSLMNNSFCLSNQFPGLILVITLCLDEQALRRKIFHNVQHIVFIHHW